MAAGFEGVRDEFERNFRERGDTGAAVAATVGGELVVDLWAGSQDAGGRVPWGEDTIVNVWSAGKPMAAMALLRLVEAGKVELEQPVARYWPEFAAGGKAELPVKYLLTHQAGLPAVRRSLPAGLALTDWDGMCAALAEQEPWWEPATAFGYHTNTFGFLVGEVVRRVDGRSVGRYIREEIAGPLGADFWVGLGAEHDHRVAEWINYERPPGARVEESGEASDRAWLERDPATVSGIDLARILAYRNPPGLPDAGVNSRLWRAAEYPSTNPHGNARALALIHGALACGGMAGGYRLLSPETIARANTIEADGEDLILGRPNRFGLGFQLTIPGVRTLGNGPHNFGHYGNGGIIGFADPDAGLGFGYVTNRGGRSWKDPRNVALIGAVYEALSS